MAVHVEYAYTTELARRASRHFLGRYLRPALLLLIALALVGLIALFNGVGHGLAYFALAAPIAYFIAWSRYVRRAEKVAMELRDPQISLTADENGFTLQSIDHTSTMAWSRMKEVWKFDDVWLLFPYGVRSAYTAVPTTALAGEVGEFIAARLAQSGTKVVG
jgi:YcxB-like protein